MFGSFGKGTGNDLFQGDRDSGIELTNRFGRSVDVLEKEALNSGSREGRLAGEHLEEDDAKSVHVGTGIDGLAIDLFGCHVFGGANHLISAGERGVVVSVA